VIGEASALGPAFRSGTFGDPALTVSEPRVGYRTATYGGAFYVFAVNESAADQQFAAQPSAPGFTGVDFALPAGSHATTVEAVSDGYDPATKTYAQRALPLTADGTGRLHFKDDFPPYAVHLYRVK
jgi:hypothetical protein